MRKVLLGAVLLLIAASAAPAVVGNCCGLPLCPGSPNCPTSPK